jgi:predicted dehydrogenase
MNGVTGRMGTNQHLLRSICAIIAQGGVKLADGEVIMPDPILVGRNEAKLRALADRAGVKNITTDLDGLLTDPDYLLYFDAQTTERRVAAVTAAIKAGKHIYCEKPTATSTAEAYELYRLAQTAGIKHGVVQDKLWLPGLLKLKRLIDLGFFGEIIAVKGEFGYWVFEGDVIPTQRPSWNYRQEDGGGMMIDMFCHWRYVIDNLFGNVNGVSATATTLIKQRWDEQGKPYRCTADDAAYATFSLDNGVLCQFNSSWNVRVNRDELLEIQVDGTKGSAVAGLRDCKFQSAAGTPKAVWNPDIESPIKYRDHWSRVPDVETFDNAFKVQWELYLKYLVQGGTFKWDLLEAAKGVQLAEAGQQSHDRRAWVDVPPLAALPVGPKAAKPAKSAKTAKTAKRR